MPMYMFTAYTYVYYDEAYTNLGTQIIRENEVHRYIGIKEKKIRLLCLSFISIYKLAQAPVCPSKLRANAKTISASLFPFCVRTQNTSSHIMQTASI